MNRLCLAATRHIEDLLDVEVGLARRRLADVVGVVGLADMQRFAVHVGEDGHRLYAHLAAGADNAHGNLTAVGDQHSFKHDEVSKASARSGPTTRPENALRKRRAESGQLTLPSTEEWIVLHWSPPGSAGVTTQCDHLWPRPTRGHLINRSRVVSGYDPSASSGQAF